MHSRSIWERDVETMIMAMTMTILIITMTRAIIVRIVRRSEKNDGICQSEVELPRIRPIRGRFENIVRQKAMRRRGKGVPGGGGRAEEGRVGKRKKMYYYHCLFERSLTRIEWKGGG